MAFSANHTVVGHRTQFTHKAIKEKNWQLCKQRWEASAAVEHSHRQWQDVTEDV